MSATGIFIPITIIFPEIKSRLQSGNACSHSVQNLMSCSLLSKNIKIKIYRTINLPLVFYGCEIWSLTLREERRLRVFENKVLRRRGTRKQRSADNYIMRSLMICIPHQILFG